MHVKARHKRRREILGESRKCRAQSKEEMVLEPRKPDGPIERGSARHRRGKKHMPQTCHLHGTPHLHGHKAPTATHPPTWPKRGWEEGLRVNIEGNDASAIVESGGSGMKGQVQGRSGKMCVYWGGVVGDLTGQVDQAGCGKDILVRRAKCVMGKSVQGEWSGGEEKMAVG